METPVKNISVIYCRQEIPESFGFRAPRQNTTHTTTTPQAYTSDCTKILR